MWYEMREFFDSELASARMVVIRAVSLALCGRRNYARNGCRSTAGVVWLGDLLANRVLASFHCGIWVSGVAAPSRARLH
jgi:hypothetical protein